MKKALIVLAIIIIGLLGFYLLRPTSEAPYGNEPQDTTEENETEPVSGSQQPAETKSVLGTSVEGRDIEAYTYGSGSNHLLFVGGIHGGYEWNTSLVAYELMAHLEENPNAVPENLMVTIVPVLNPDGLYKVIGTSDTFSRSYIPSLSLSETIPGRFNANGVDLNRNFDCDWQATGTWQDRSVSGGSAAFSEPESLAIKNYVEANNPTAVVVWYSSAGGVFSSNCHEGVLPETRTLTNLYANASGYPAYEEFDFYEITGDLTNWLAKGGIPAISVLLTTHDDTEWTKNRAGIEALFDHYSG